jgi:UDP-3-O-acyl-N-acetylglucosamine deacetylase
VSIDAGCHSQDQQVTTIEPVSVRGHAAFTREPAQVTFLPADVDQGIVFDVAGVRIPAQIQILDESFHGANSTSLRDGQG